MDTKTVINFVNNAIIIYACFCFINDVLKEKLVVEQLGKVRSFILKIVFGLMIMHSNYSILMFHHSSYLQLMSDSVGAILLLLIFYLNHKYVFPLIPDEFKQ